MPLTLTDSFATSPAIAEAMSERAFIAGVFAFEAALARAQALEGVISDGAAEIIAQTATQMNLAPEDVADDAALAGALTIPLVKRLIAEVRRRDAAAAGYVHFGATSQDAMDTSLVLQLDRAVAEIDATLARLAQACARLADAHRSTIMLGRTLLQPATPIAFGQKAAQWLLAAYEDRTRLRHAARAALRIQFGGASGNLGSLSEKGAAVSARLSALLPLRFGETTAPVAREPVTPWHTRRGNLLALCSAFAISAGNAAKMARDVSLMCQWEVGEASEPAEAGRGVSSAMPHKRNPVRCMAALAAGTRAPGLLATLMAGAVQEHERAFGGWQAEWAALPDLVKLSGGAIAYMADVVDGLALDTARMRSNFDSLRGLPLAEMAALALAPSLGRDAAHALVSDASRRAIDTGATLAEEISKDPVARNILSDAQLAAVFDPAEALGATSTFIDHALGLWRAQDAAFNETAFNMEKQNG